MTTTQERQRTTTGREPPSWYPIRLQLRYSSISKRRPLYGFGQTTMMSSQGITFAASNGLEPGMVAEVALAWPFRLDNRIRLQLVLHVMITGSEDGVTEAQILAYHFRPRRPGGDTVLNPARGLTAEVLGASG